MAKNSFISVKEPIYKLQLYLLDGIQTQNQLFAAGSLMSKNDYQDVVTERSISQACGYPLCTNSIASDSSNRKGRYRISLKEHKVYDLQETRMYCSTKCLIESRAFLGSLQEERSSVLDSGKIDEIMEMFGESGEEKRMGKNGDLGMSELRIRENEDVQHGVVPMDEWIGQADAIEGYVPQHSKSAELKKQKEVVKPSYKRPPKKIDLKFNEFDFKSTIITQDEYSMSKLPTQLTGNGFGSVDSNSEREASCRDMNSGMLGPLCDLALTSLNTTKFEEPNQEKSVVNMINNLSISEISDSVGQSGPAVSIIESKNGPHTGKTAESDVSMLKPSLKSSSSKNVTRSVTWDDEKSADNKKLFKISDLEDTKMTFEGSNQTNTEDYDSLRLASAEACALALNQAAEAVASGVSDVPDAVSEAGIIVMPPPMDEEHIDMDMEPATVNWSKKHGITQTDFFDNSDDSWYDDVPEGFNLELSPFATMFTTLFSWLSSSSLAYIYGQDESSHEEFMSVNGREYPRKVIAIDGRSSEIMQTVAGCLARTLPELVGDLRLPIPISTLEKGMSCLLATFSFIDPVPPFRLKQWQVIVVLFINALSVSRIPSIAPHMTSRRRLLQKVLDEANISAEHYEIMKDLLIPLGRVPYFSAQSGG